MSSPTFLYRQLLPLLSGGGVYVASGSTFTMSGSAKVDENNDVYLSNGTKIEVTGTLTHKPAAKI
ncbi:hypothetical protein, partial [Treponema pedis]|uniref:hypothetical protein n=1 Tax=Treponema pedis TaxID=409322 RepID=UPI0012697DC8